jgi:ATPase subunit of ABC transporter with duplicated ATPase domains
MSSAKTAFVTLDAVAAVTPDGRPLFDNLSLAFGAERTGLVGRNGAGKSTLLRLIAGEQPPAAGTVTRTGTLGVLRQTHAPPADASLGEWMGLGEGLARLVRIEAGQGSDEDFNLADWTLAARAEAALAEVGLAGLDLDRPAAALSGGQATRAALAGLLAMGPDLILLDEPTNNLDVEAREMIASALQARRGGAVVVSHDRTLLRGMDRIVELSTLGAAVYGGGYDLYAERKAAERVAAAQGLAVAEREAGRAAREAQAARERQARRDAAGKRAAAKGDQPKVMLGTMAGWAEASGARGERQSERKIEAASSALAEARSRVEREQTQAFDLPSAGLATGKPVLRFEAVGFGWPGGPPILRDVDFSLIGPERVAVVGRNGAGKSTLLRLAVGDLTPTEGTISLMVRTALLDQRTALLDEEASVLGNFRRLNPEADANRAHAALARFGFRNVAADQIVGTLSGGERLRAGLACVLAQSQPPQLLILDEPTNHLDLASTEALEAALRAYDGALLVASHDADFLEAIGIERRIAL